MTVRVLVTFDADGFTAERVPEDGAPQPLATGRDWNALERALHAAGLEAIGWRPPVRRAPSVVQGVDGNHIAVD